MYIQIPKTQQLKHNDMKINKKTNSSMAADAGRSARRRTSPAASLFVLCSKCFANVLIDIVIKLICVVAYV